ncbi:MAG: hypothetical protein QM755_11405 [Luteolibacter sp.]
MNSSSTIDESEWNFSEHVLPEEEVRACLIWECGRECREFFLAERVAELREQATTSRWNKEQQMHVTNPPHVRRAARKEIKALAFDLDAHWKRLYSSHLAFSSFYHQVISYARPWSKPWREIEGKTRAVVAKQLADHGIFPPLCTSNLMELEALWNSNGTEVFALRDGTRKPVYDDDLEMLGFEESQPVEIPRDERDPGIRELNVAFSINFSLFTDSEITEAFRVWLAAARPCPPPLRRGKKVNDDRAALEGLGAMRALNRFSFSHPNFPEPLKRRGQRACYKGRILARKRYREVFPFLEVDAAPMSWRTSGSNGF